MRDLPKAALTMPVAPEPNDASSGALVTTLDTKNQACDSSLEGLPPEVRRQILSILDLPTLKALVRASPTFHQQYLHDRRHLLSTSLETTLGSTSLDAYILNEVRNPKLSSPEFPNGLLETWREQLPDGSSFRLTGAITEDEAADMASYYFKLVTPVARHFMTESLNDMENRVGKVNDKSGHQPEVSNIEWQRSLRATYRFDLLCSFTDPTMPELSHEIAKSNANYLLFTPEPWEAEELLCFYQFVEKLYTDVFNVIIAEARENHPRFVNQDRESTLVGIFDLDPSRKPMIPPISNCLEIPHSHLATGTTRDYLEGTALHGGLQLLYDIIFLHIVPPYNLELLVAKMKSSIISSDIPIDTGDGILGLRHQEDRRRRAPSRRDELTSERAPFPFQGDDLSRPPLGWTIMWGGTYINLIGAFIPKDTRRWGYVFWDEDRMKRDGGIELMEKPGMKFRGLRDWRDRLDEMRELESRR